jgi:type I restriction enzyme S subunit
MSEKLPDGWKRVKLGEVCIDISYGYTASAKLNPKGVKFLRITDIVSDRIDWENVPYCEIPKKEIEKYKLKIGDIVIARTGATTGYNKIIKKNNIECVFASYLIRYRVNKEIADPFYVWYNLQSDKWKGFVDNIVGGSAQPGANAKQFADFEFYLPPLPEQKAIAGILSSLDDKIDLLHRQNKTLEEMAQTLFRKWFIEDAQEDWEEKPLSFFGDIVCGKTPSKKIKEYFNGEIPFIKIPDMHGNTFILQTSDSLTEEGKNSQKNKTLPPKSICVSCIATVGLVSMTVKESQTNQQINSIVPKKDFYRYYLFLFMKDIKDLLIAMASGGTTTLNLNTKDFSNIKIPLPEENILKTFHSIVEPIFDKILYNQLQIRTLEQLRDTLLPKLMSGEVRVKL